jgi:hypothetical protein
MSCFGGVGNMTPKAHENDGKNRQVGLYQLKTFCRTMKTSHKSESVTFGMGENTCQSYI